MPAQGKSKFPKAKKKPGNPPRNVPGREAKVEQKGPKWVYKFKRGDMEDLEFDTQQEALDYAKQMRARAVKTTIGKVRAGL